MTETKEMPVHKIRYGNVTVAIWENLGDEGRTFYKSTLSRRYKKDDQWHDTQNLDVGDHLDAAKALDEAHTWIVQMLREQAKFREDAREPEASFTERLGSTKAKSGGRAAA